MRTINMLVFRIIATVLLGISCFTALVKNINIYARHNTKQEDIAVIVSTAYGWIWRAFVIVVLWLI